MVLKSDYRVYVAQDGITALQILKDEDIDLVISDVNMPKITGHGLLMCIKEYDPTIEVIFYTGCGSVNQAQFSGQKYGVFACLSKPCNILELRRLVKDGIALRQKHRLPP